MIAPNEPNDPQLPDEPKHDGGNGRNHLGRFDKGNPGGPGNPLVAIHQRNLCAIANATTVEEAVKLWRAMLELAASMKGGPDWRFAVQEVFARLFGKPVENLKLDASFTMNVVNYFREVAERARATG